MNLDGFSSDFYQRHNKRRQEHLASLHLDLSGRSVLEIGAGIGDHTSFFLDRNCRVTSTDGRPECVAALKARHPQTNVLRYDANGEPPAEIQPHQIVYAYGVLYHLKQPAHALATMSRLCTEMLLLETCVSNGSESPVAWAEEADEATQALDGTGCRPTRQWVWSQLSKLFEHVYVTTTQPWHEEFPVDWTKDYPGLIRSVFVASRRPIENRLLSPTLLNKQGR
jgi:2-polyprenyl-3-methyl-5-hydroxy-6-metoxy-1,4-benzoquinol methylase